MTDRTIRRTTRGNVDESGVAAAGALAGIAALFSAAACCVLPLVLAAVGLGAGSLAVFVPYHWPLTIAALVIIAAGWALYLRKTRACPSASGECKTPGRSTATLVMLGLATAAIAFSAMWGFIEQPLMRALGGA